jgi:hypothetical protein
MAELDAKTARLEAAENKAARQSAESEAVKYKAYAERTLSPDVQTLQVTPRIVEAKPKFLLTLCSMVKNDAPYIVEWIEFLRLQGVDRFILYDDGSADQLNLLNQLCSERSQCSCLRCQRTKRHSLGKTQ